ncbi:cupin domain-containing protein [Niveispirillum fermenti]|uniref:cupin domain-containing protein n=1 Tax=Niveispirillum fermenti TaxID=1233113 RepID=UPI003A8964B9
MQVRRVVTGLSAEGRSKVVADGPVPRSHDFKAIPGFSNVTVWSTKAGASLRDAAVDRTVELSTLLAEPSGTTFFIVQFPPDAVWGGVDPAAADEETARVLPGLADTFDPQRPGFHATPSIDHVIVLDGELWLQLEEGPETLLRRGDVVIQNGTWHAWHNRTDQPAVIAAISLGVAPE